jgi:hypothetical protein
MKCIAEQWFLHVCVHGELCSDINSNVMTVFLLKPSGHLSKHTLKVPVRFFFCEAIGTAATPGLLCQPRVIVKTVVEKQMECRLAGETEVLGENLSQRHFSVTALITLPSGILLFVTIKLFAHYAQNLD